MRPGRRFGLIFLSLGALCAAFHYWDLHGADDRFSLRMAMLAVWLPFIGLMLLVVPGAPDPSAEPFSFRAYDRERTRAWLGQQATATKVCWGLVAAVGFYFALGYVEWLQGEAFFTLSRQVIAGAVILLMAGVAWWTARRAA